MEPIPSPRPVRKQAVLVIHGVGSQRPMATLASFVDAIWSGKSPKIWFKPDTRSRNFDLSQIVAIDKANVRTDFYELYWAHLMEGTRFYAVWRWFLHDLLERRSEDMTDPMREAKDWVNLALWSILLVYSIATIVVGLAVLATLPRSFAVTLAVLATGAAILSGLARFGRTAIVAALYALAFWWHFALRVGNDCPPDRLLLAAADLRLFCPPDFLLPAALAFIAVLTLGLLWLDRRVISPIVGDAARYLRSDPDNVAARQAIRALGVDALNRLHGAERNYERIIVVGHSLGALIGYDILRYAFAQRFQDCRIPVGQLPPEVAAYDRACAHPASPGYRAAQAALREAVGGLTFGGPPPGKERERAEKRWLVSDFVTLGSPLTHARVLLAGTCEEFERRKETRLLPTNPPSLSSAANERGIRGFYAWEDETGSFAQPHHGAVFAMTRWTNLYFPARQMIYGDIIGGPVAPILGPGVKDVAVHTGHLWGRGLFSHTSYWTRNETLGRPSHLEALATALNLDGGDGAANLPDDTGPSTGT